MPLLKLSNEERKAAVAAASADLKFHMAEKNAPAEMQDAIFHKGFINLQLFAGLDETRADVRKAVVAEIGLDPEEGAAARVAMASLLAAWESARLQASTEEKLKVESRLGQSQRVIQLSEMAAMRKAVEADFGLLKDSEVPAKSLVEIRKKAYQLVRLGEASALANALETACKSPELLNLHFVMPLTTSADFFAPAGSDAVAFPPVPAHLQRPRKGSGKGNPRAVKKGALKSKTAAGRPICFRWNNGKCSGNCGFEDVCQICESPEHGRKHCPRKPAKAGDA